MGLVSGLVGGIAEGVGGAYDHLTPGSGSSSLTKAGQAVTNPNVVLSNPSGVFTKAPAFTPVTTAPAASGGAVQDNSAAPDTSAQLGATGSSTTLSPADIAYLDSQAGTLKALLGQSDTTLNQGLANLSDSYNSQVSAADQQRSRALDDYATQDQNTTAAKDTALGTVDTNSRTLNNSLRSILGQAGGSDSSAYLLAAPNAVARQASTQRNGVLNDYSTNEAAVSTAKDRATQDFATLLDNLAQQRNQQESTLRSGVLTNDQNVQKQLADIAAQKASAQGLGYAGAIAAQQPYSSAIQNDQTSIDSLFDQFRTPTFNVTPVTTSTPDLSDYTVNSAAIGTPASQALDPTTTYSSYLANLKKQQDDNATVNPALVTA